MYDVVQGQAVGVGHDYRAAVSKPINEEADYRNAAELLSGTCF